MSALINAGDAHHELELHATRIRTSGILARSAHLHSVFEYLYHCHRNGKTPFDVSGFTVGSAEFGELADTNSGKTYINNRIPADHTNKAQHLAYLAAFNGPTNNRKYRCRFSRCRFN